MDSRCYVQSYTWDCHDTSWAEELAWLFMGLVVLYILFITFMWSI